MICRISPSLMLLLCVVASLSGCNKPAEFQPVRGRVTIGQTPVTGATVLFEDASAGVAVTSPLDEDGRYQIRTYEGDGLRAGTYRVAVTPGGSMRDDSETPLAGQALPPRPVSNADAIPEKYHSTATSPLTAEVAPGTETEHNFDLSQ